MTDKQDDTSSATFEEIEFDEPEENYTKAAPDDWQILNY